MYCVFRAQDQDQRETAEAFVEAERKRIANQVRSEIAVEQVEGQVQEKEVKDVAKKNVKDQGEEQIIRLSSSARRRARKKALEAALKEKC